MNPLLRCCFVLLLAAFGPAVSAADAWAELSRPGAIVLFRHATAPGVGDPERFRLEDCRTQRNLSDEGRAEAWRLGEQFRQRRIAVAAVLTSQWCRARDTARLMFGEQAMDEPAFNSFFRQAPAQRDAQTAQARALLARWKGPGALVVVTHQVNITALTGIGAMSAEGVVVRVGGDGKVEVVGSLRP
jgi:phosphohistidine phosphatase SixA